MKKLYKNILRATLAFATAYGTFRNNEGFPLMYNHITKDSAGICLGIVNAIDEGVTYNGALVSGFRYNAGRINGVSVGLGNLSSGTNSSMNGLEAGIVNLSDTIRMDITPVRINGVQLGLFNHSTERSHVLQLGFGFVKEKASASFPIGYSFPSKQSPNKFEAQKQ